MAAPAATYGGLCNMGNTCGINTLTQCIFSVERLRNLLVNSRLPQLPQQPQQESQDSVAGQLKDIFSIFLSGHSITPRAYVNMIYEQFRNFIYPGEQLDIGELWMLIGDKLSDEYGAEGRAASDAGDAAFVDAFVSKINKNKTSDWIESIQGVSISTTECNTCREKVINPEVFIALTLDIFDNIPDMSEMILNFFKTEEMQEWKCDKCKTLGGSKRLHLHKLPPVLVILLKRFKMSAAGIEKLHNPVNILQGVDITYQNKKCSYKLKSIGNHFGAYGGGHYTACCNSGAVWNHIDDLSINNLKIEDIVTNNTAAYILFYEQAAAE